MTGETIDLSPGASASAKVPASSSFTQTFPAEPAQPTSFGPYEVQERIGAGGMGIVYRVRLRDSQEDLALKVLLASYAAFPIGRARFLREAQAAASLSHPKIVRIRDLGEQDGLPYMVLDYVPGGSLDERLNREGGLPLRDAVTIIRGVAEALQHAHAKGVVHRDLKPANILLASSGPMLTDFGLCKQLDGSGQSLTDTGQILGTPAYMPPEQVRGKALDGRADVYSLGATLFEAITGRAPFEEDSAILTLQATLAEPPARPSSLRAEVDPQLEAICLRCLEKDPQERFQSAKALVEALGSWLEHTSGRRGRKVKLKVPSFLTRRRRAADRNTKSLCPRQLAELSSGSRRGVGSGRSWSAIPLGAAAAVLLVLVMVLGLQDRVEASRQESIAQEEVLVRPEEPGAAPWLSALELTGR